MKYLSNKIGGWLDAIYQESAYYQGAIDALACAGLEINTVPCGSRAVHIVKHRRQKSEPSSGPFCMKIYGSGYTRHKKWGVYDTNGELVCVCAYKVGAQNVIEILNRKWGVSNAKC